MEEEYEKQTTIFDKIKYFQVMIKKEVQKRGLGNILIYIIC